MISDNNPDSVPDWVKNSKYPSTPPTPEEWGRAFPNLIFVDKEKLARDQKWHDRWFKRAEEVSTWSKDPSTKVGAVFVNEEKHRELSAGYNGFPRGIKDDDRLNNREIKYKLVVHAEMNGIFNAVNNGVTLDGCSLYVWGLPICSECAKGIIQVGVKKIYVKKQFVDNERWKESWKLTQQIFSEAEIKVIVI
jgi:dCMP deaminase